MAGPAQLPLKEFCLVVLFVWLIVRLVAVSIEYLEVSLRGALIIKDHTQSTFRSFTRRARTLVCTMDEPLAEVPSRERESLPVYPLTSWHLRFVLRFHRRLSGGESDASFS